MFRKRLLAVAGPLVLLVALGTFQAFHRPAETESVRHIVVLYTNDLHGHLEAGGNNGGITGLVHRWRKEGLAGDDRFLLLDGGDMWTGPLLSTYFQGESTLEIMNAIGYDAVALGNHDLDFGLDALRQRAQQARFPILAANVRDKDGNPLDFLQPFTVMSVNRVRVGVIGLTTNELLTDTQIEAAENLRLIPYETALQEAAAQARAAGADLLILIGHLCQAEAYRLATLAAEQEIVLLGGGHCHEILNAAHGNVQLVQSGSFADGYLRIDVYFDLAAKRLVWLHSSYRRNLPGKGDAQVNAWIARWRAALPADLNRPIGYLGQSIGRESKAMASLLTQAWKSAYPTAEIILATPRYIAQPLPAGPITPGLWFDVLPTRNTLLEARLTGEQIIRLIEGQRPLYGGIVEDNGCYLLSDGSPLQATASYSVIFPEALSIRYGLREIPNLTLTDTGIDWRQAILDWLIAHPTSPDHPLEAILQ